MTYPRSSESHQNILVIIQNDFIKVASGNLDSSRRGWWLDLGLDTRLCGNTIEVSYVLMSNEEEVADKLAKESRSRPPW